MNTKYAWIGVLVSLALVLGFAGSAFALGFTNGTLIPVAGNDFVAGNDNDIKNDPSLLPSMVEPWYGSTLPYDLEFYAKIDVDDGLTTTEGSGILSINQAGTSGTWTAGTGIAVYSVKASTGYSLYWGNNETSGSWDTSDLPGNKNGKNQDISHITTWIFKDNGNTGGNNNAPVPEPSTVFLMGIGLVGLGVTSYRKRQRK